MWRVETTVYIQGNNRKTSAGWSTSEECWPHSGNLLCWVAAERQSRLNRFLWQRHKVHNNKGPLPTGGRHPVCFFSLFLFFGRQVQRRGAATAALFLQFWKKSWCVCDLTSRLMVDLPVFGWHHMANGAPAVADSLHVSLLWRWTNCYWASQNFVATFHCRFKPFVEISTSLLTIKTIHKKCNPRRNTQKS